MSSDRREFIRRASALAAAIGTGQHASTPDDQPASMPTPRAKAMMGMLNLTRPIMQAGMGGIAVPPLAIAVSNAGALGSIGLTNANAERVKALVTEMRAGTTKPFAVNYLLAFDVTTLDVALDAGAPVVQFAWGMPSSEFVAAIHRANAKLGIQIASVEGATRAIDLGADFLICQGIEAGGHVQSSALLDEMLPRVVAAAGKTHVLAGGGIAHGRAIRRALVAGASGVLIGTRFVATKEADAHADYKNALLRAKASDTAFTTCFQDGWAATHRVLRNDTFATWEAAGCPAPGKRPGEGDAVAAYSGGSPIVRYRFAPPRVGMTGNVAEMALYAGRGVESVRDLPAAGALVDRLWRECVSARVG